MKPSPIQLGLGYVATALQMVVVFHTPLGISDNLSDVLQIVALGCLAGFFIIHYRRRKAAVSAGTPLVTATPKQQRRMTWIIVVILLVGTLSGPFWLPYTGVVLPFRLLVVTSVISCILSLAVYFIARRVMRPKT